MNVPERKIGGWCYYIILAGFLVFSVPSYSQGLDFFGSMGSKKERARDAVTTIAADSMDISINDNIAVFSGSVVIDDQEIKIECDKMKVYLKEDKKTKGGKKISKIICLGNVVMNRKLYDKDDKEKGAQKGTAGKVVYDIESGDITMTENPVLSRGKDVLKGKKAIIFNRYNSTLKVVGGRFSLRSGALKSGDKKKERK